MSLYVFKFDKSILPILIPCKRIIEFPTNMLRNFCTEFLSVSFGGTCRLFVSKTNVLRFKYLQVIILGSTFLSSAISEIRISQSKQSLPPPTPPHWGVGLYLSIPQRITSNYRHLSQNPLNLKLLTYISLFLYPKGDNEAFKELFYTRRGAK